jgi:predicted Rossmann-fold nucleotide-binding protein
MDFMLNRLVAMGTIDPEDLDRLVLTDSPEEAAAIVREVGIRKFGLRYRKAAPRRRRFLFE